ncbi:MAG: hypothetical protein Q9168_002934 [Polycauliona sp. 1 TL-2023]
MSSSPSLAKPNGAHIASASSSNNSKGQPPHGGVNARQPDDASRHDPHKLAPIKSGDTAAYANANAQSASAATAIQPHRLETLLKNAHVRRSLKSSKGLKQLGITVATRKVSWEDTSRIGSNTDTPTSGEDKQKG